MHMHQSMGWNWGHYWLKMNTPGEDSNSSDRFSGPFRLGTQDQISLSMWSSSLALLKWHTPPKAHTLSSIASCDWPDEYPELLNNLIALLSSNSPDSVHGALQVFVEFVKADLTEDQILPVLRQLLPVLLSILGAAEVGACCTFALFLSLPSEITLSITVPSPAHAQSPYSINVLKPYLWWKISIQIL